MAVKILALDGLNDAKLCELTTQLLQTIPGVNTARIDFLSQKLTMDISGRDENDTIDEVVTTLKETIPDITVTRTDIGEGGPQASGRANHAQRDEEDDSPRRIPQQEEKKKRKRSTLSFHPDTVIYLVGLIIAAVFLSVSFWKPSLMVILCGVSLALGAMFALFFHWSRPRRGYLAVTIVCGLLSLAVFLLGDPRFGAGAMLCYLAGTIVVSVLCDQFDENIRGVMNISPERLVRLREGTLAQVPPEQVLPGDKLLLSTGDRIPFDGVITEGSALVDVSLLTGEPEPVTLRAGESVHCGETIVRGPLTMEVDAPQKQSQTYRLYAALVDDPPETPTERQVRKWAAIGNAVLLGCAVAVGFLRFTPESVSAWLVPALGAAFLALPCGVGTIAGFMLRAGAARLLKAGILPGSLKLFDSVSRVRTVATGYTGILTYGEFRVSRIIPVEGASADEVLRDAAAAENGVPHPIAQAIAERYEQVFQKKASDVIKTPGEWVMGYGARTMIGRRSITVGSGRLLRESEIELPENTSGNVCVHVLDRGEYIGTIELEDEFLPGAQELVAGLHAAGVEKTVLLTGCDSEVGLAAQSALGFDEVFSEKVLSAKQTILSSLTGEEEGRDVVYAGGVDELELMGVRSIGVVMGVDPLGPPLSAAGAVIPSGDPGRFVQFIRLARGARFSLLLGLYVSLGVRALLLAALFFWNIPLPFTALANAAASVFLAANALFFLQGGKGSSK